MTFSPKVFVPLTMLCRDRCGYCTFAKPPRPASTTRTFDDDAVLAIARAGAAAGCYEALFTLGEAPEERYPPRRPEWLAAHGYASTVDHLGRGRGPCARRDRSAPPRQRRRAERGPSSCACGRSARRRG